MATKVRTFGQLFRSVSLCPVRAQHKVAVAETNVESVNSTSESHPTTRQASQSPSRQQRRQQQSPSRLVKRVGRGLSQNREMFTQTCERAGLKPVIGTVGGGNMSKALLHGFIKADLLPKSGVFVSDPGEASRKMISELGVGTSKDNDEVLRSADGGIVILAVKPHILPKVASENGEQLRKAGLVISILAGVTLETLEKEIGPGVAIVRVMPNTPALIGAAASVYCGNGECSQEHGTVVQQLMSTVGTCHQVPESQLDAVTGLSGSGPAYVFTFIDALSDGGVRQGLPRDLATQLAAQTVMGAAKMVLETGQHPCVLKNQVCSPGGTTIAGVHSLELSGLRGAMMNAVEAATKRANELGKQ